MANVSIRMDDAFKEVEEMKKIRHLGNLTQM